MEEAHRATMGTSQEVPAGDDTRIIESQGSQDVSVEVLLEMELQDFVLTKYPENVQVTNWLRSLCQVLTTGCVQVDHIVLALLDQKTTDEHLRVFGGVAVNKQWKTRADEPQLEWLVSLRMAIRSADKASQFLSGSKARRPRVNSRWRDALVQLTSAMENILGSKEPLMLPTMNKSSSSRSRSGAKYIFPRSIEEKMLQKEGLNNQEEQDLKLHLFRMLCLSRARLLRQVGLWRESLHELDVLLIDSEATPTSGLEIDTNGHTWQVDVVIYMCISLLSYGL